MAGEERGSEEDIFTRMSTFVNKKSYKGHKKVRRAGRQVTFSASPHDPDQSRMWLCHKRIDLTLDNAGCL